MPTEWCHTEFQATCPVCAADGRKAAILATDHVLSNHPRVTLLRCAGCGAAFLSDLAIPAYEHELSGLIDYYVEQGGGVDLMVAPLLRLPPDSVRRCLEIGCGFGFALDFCRHSFGWEVLGVDPSSLAASGAAILKLPIVPAYFDAALDIGPEPFDLVLCSEILEHVAEPHGLLAAIRNRLSPDGLLVLSTPNLAIVKEGSDEGVLGRALSPGLHLVLYDRASLSMVLAKAGFSDVIIEESAETLHAFAAGSRAPLDRLRPVAPDAQRAMLRDYFTNRADSSTPASAAASGFAYRHFKECVNAGLYAEAAISRDRLARVYRERHGLELERPVQLEANPSQKLPFNLTGALFFSGILELNSLDRSDRAAAYFSAAVKAGTTLLNDQSPWGLHDGETEALLQQSRKHLPMALAATDPDRAVTEVEALDAKADERGTLPPALVAEARAQTFVRLVNAGAYDAAARIAPPIDLASLEKSGEPVPGTLDAPFCLGMLALHQSRPREAAELFGAVHRTARRHPRKERAELLWSARFHEGLSFRLAGLDALAREAFIDVASSRALGQLPPVPSHLGDAARGMLPDEALPEAQTSGNIPSPAPNRLLIAERFIAPVARLSGIIVPLDVIAREHPVRLHLIVAREGTGASDRRNATLASVQLPPADSLRLAFAPFDTSAGDTFVLGALELSNGTADPDSSDLDAIFEAAAVRTPITLDCLGERSSDTAAGLLPDERAIATSIVRHVRRPEIRTAHALDAYWCDAHGIYLRGWIHAYEHRVHSMRVESAGCSADVDAWAERPDLLEFYPEHDHVRNGGFAVYLECPPGHPVTLTLETEGGIASFVLPLPGHALPAWPEEESDGRELSPILRRFAALANERRGRLLQIGSRAPAGVEPTPPHRIFEGRVVGLDIHPGHHVDLVGDAHQLSRFLRAASFDAVFSSSVLEHLASPWLLPAEINRVLKPGGLVYHQAPAAWPNHAQPNDFWRMSSEGLRVLFGPANGFEILEVADSGAAAIVPGPKWRRKYLDMPTTPAFAMAEILARKIEEVSPEGAAEAPATGTSEARSQRYPLAGLRPIIPGERS
ncbi:MAG: methyltransferase domain-containing protein [Thermoanaerobaculia bacterium]|jgi:SAM-dependent methyltransferase